MKRFLLAVPVLLGALALTLPASAGKAKEYGKGLSDAELVAISALLEKPDAYVGKKVRVEGLVTDVCKHRGCWIKLAGDKEFQTMRIKVDDGVIVFPVEAKGKKAVAEGVFERHELTKEQAIARAKHHAEEQGKKFDPSTVKDGEVFFQIRGEGAVIR